MSLSVIRVCYRGAASAGMMLLVLVCTGSIGALAAAAATAAILTATNSAGWVELGNKAFRAGQRSNAVEYYTKAIDLGRTNQIAYYNRARLLDLNGRHAEAVADFTALLALNPGHPGARQLRGALHLRRGELPEALADFDDYIKRVPRAGAAHWQRGIALYLLGRYEDGRMQFASCQAANTNDVEHALWHFLCLAKTNGVEKARPFLLKPGRDRRPIMQEIHALYAGQLKPAQVLAASDESTDTQMPGEVRKFYARYYLALYYDVLGDTPRCLELLKEAADMPGAVDILPDVARVQLRLRAAAK